MSQNNQRPYNVISPIVAINYEEGDGINLEWNLCGISNKVSETCNLFIFQNIGEQSAQQMVKEFYDQSLFGDLFGVVSLDKQNTFQNIEWIEKSGFGLSPDFVTKSNIDFAFPEQIIQSLLPKFKRRRGMNMIYLIDPTLEIKSTNKQSTYDIQNLTRIFYEWKSRNEPTGTVIFNMITDKIKENKIDIIRSSNVFSSMGKSSSSVLKTLKKYINSVKLSKMVLRVKFLDQNFHIGFSKNQGWVNVDFNIIEKKFYNFPALQFTEKIVPCFADSNSSTLLKEIYCLFELQLTFLDGNECQASKLFQLGSQDSKKIHKTINILPTSEFQPKQIWKGEKCLINLYNSRHYVFFQYIKKTNGNRKMKWGLV